jgi:deazaflavin-dependent oxidoreductase (nitroreductase family)
MSAELKGRALAARSAVHRAVFSATNGRALRRWGGVPVVLLITTGRRSGRLRPVIVGRFGPVGDVLVVVASDGGAPRHPAWYLNVEAHPDLEVVLDGSRRRVRARTATPEEKADLWPRIIARAPSYARYQERAAREIPVVLLEPVTDSPR